jgi:hypothetical protein
MLFELNFLPLLMSEETVNLPKHPVAPRLTNGHEKPRIGPDIDAYHAARKGD